MTHYKVRSAAQRQAKQKADRELRESRRKEAEKNLSLFAQHAFLFFDNAERILSDSRLFNASVCVDSGLAYVGPAKTPTLGSYVQWWLNGKGGTLTNEKGEALLMCKLSGSPLTGVNNCMVVNRQGKTSQICIFGFLDTYRSFIQYSKRYSTECQSENAYSLEEVIDLLKNEKKL